MDFVGLFRRVIGVAGVALVTFGVASQGDVSTATDQVATLAGSAMFLYDFAVSVFSKITKK